MTTIIIAIIAALVGALATALIMQTRQQAVKTKADVLETQLKLAQEQAQASRQEAEQHLAQQKQEAERLLLAQKQETERQHRESLEMQQRQFDETMAKVAAQMKNATDEMLKQRQKEFSEASSTNLGQIVNPLRETIDKMKQAMADNTEKQTAMGGEMRANLEQMIRQSEAARKSAEETILAALLDAQGFKRGIHYDTQPYIRDASGNVVKTEDGIAMRPDIILHLDQRREVVIDSKVSLTAFMDYTNAATDAERQRHLKAHIESIKTHVRSLSAKDYSAYIQPPKVRMDYVIMFVPHSAALWTALNAQPDLWRNAMTQNVFIADEQTLFAALRIINLTWTQIAQAQNHEKVYALANEMLDRVGQFMKKYDEIGAALDKAQKAHQEGSRKLAPQGQSILTTCAKLQKLGAKQSDRNPLPQITDIDDIAALEAMPDMTDEPPATDNPDHTGGEEQ